MVHNIQVMAAYLFTSTSTFMNGVNKITWGGPFRIPHANWFDGISEISRVGEPSLKQDKTKFGPTKQWVQLKKNMNMWDSHEILTRQLWARNIPLKIPEYCYKHTCFCLQRHGSPHHPRCAVRFPSQAPVLCEAAKPPVFEGSWNEANIMAI